MSKDQLRQLAQRWARVPRYASYRQLARDKRVISHCLRVGKPLPERLRQRVFHFPPDGFCNP